MNTTKKLLTTTIAATVLAGGIAMPAAAEVSASATIANMYFWRGQDLGNGSPAISGDLVYSHGDFSGGLWVSSGDDTAGNEYDFFVDYTHDFGEFTLGAAIWDYEYEKDEGDLYGDLSDLILTAAAWNFSFSYYQPLAGDNDYNYWTLGYSHDKYSVTVGRADSDADGDADGDGIADSDIDGYTHLDIGYAYNDNLSFTVSSIVDEEEDNAQDQSLKFVIAYSVPLK